MLVNNTCLLQLLFNRIEKLTEIKNLCSDLDAKNNNVEGQTTENYRDYKNNLLAIIEKYSAHGKTSWVEFLEIVYKYCDFLIKCGNKDQIMYLATVCVKIDDIYIQELSANKYHSKHST